MSRFKVGDTLIRIEGEWDGHEVGSISKLIAIGDRGLDFEDGTTMAWSAQYDLYEAAKDEPVDLKFDQHKVKHELLMIGCPNAIDGVSQVLTFGAKKYEAHSWKNVTNNVERYKGALYRHMNAIERGELVDPESGLSHWYHAATNAMFLAELEGNKNNV